MIWSTTRLRCAALALALVELTSAAVVHTRTIRWTNLNPAQDITKVADDSVSYLHQTNRREIQARNEYRNSPFYRRQQASAAVYPICSATYNGELSVARYRGVDVQGGDPVPYMGPTWTETEGDCLKVCQGQPGCIGYFYWATGHLCFPKATLAADQWTSTSQGAQDPGSVAAFIGDCASVNPAIQSKFQGLCCNSPAVQETTPAPPEPSPSVPEAGTCRSRVSAPVPVARLVNTDLFGWDMAPSEAGSFQIKSESDCILSCYYTDGCSGYFYWPDSPSGGQCYLKQTGWNADSFNVDNAPAQAPGSVAGLLGQSCVDLQGFVSNEVYQHCCDN